jgi:nucleoside-diphosphate-sugar epimerase
LAVLKFLLLVLGRSNIDPYRNFNSEKLQKLGFDRPVSLAAGLSEYIAWYKKAVLGK